MTSYDSLKKELSWKHNDDLFFKELKEGHAWQELPATFFRLHGLSVEIPELKVRESIDQAEQWISTVDLIVAGRKLEIKSRNEIFTSPMSFPYDTVFVDTVSGYDAKNPKPLAYIMISRPTGAMLCLKANNSNGWNIEKKFDNVRKIHDDFYMCKKQIIIMLP